PCLCAGHVDDFPDHGTWFGHSLYSTWHHDRPCTIAWFLLYLADPHSFGLFAFDRNHKKMVHPEIWTLDVKRTTKTEAAFFRLPFFVIHRVRFLPFPGFFLPIASKDLLVCVSKIQLVHPTQKPLTDH